MSDGMKGLCLWCCFAVMSFRRDNNSFSFASACILFFFFIARAKHIDSPHCSGLCVERKLPSVSLAPPSPRKQLFSAEEGNFCSFSVQCKCLFVKMSERKSCLALKEERDVLPTLCSPGRCIFFPEGNSLSAFSPVYVHPKGASV